jgi:SAM-dependent methyltransferase
LGVEPSRWATSVGTARGLPIVNGTIENLPDTVPLFDAVTIWDVIEHLPDPLGDLRRIRPLIRPGGVIAISTMDVEAPVARLLGRHWPWYMQMHLYYFSRKTLSRLVEQAGYEVIEIRRHRRIVRLAYLLSRIERRAAWLYRWLDRTITRLGLSDRLVAVDLGDIVTLFARARGPLLAGGTNGHAAR